MSPPAPVLVRAVLACLLFPTVVACGQGAAGGNAPERRFYTAGELPGLVLHRDEGPKETEFREEASGSQDLERFWPSSCCLGVQARFEEAGFQTAHVAVFERPGHSADPIDTRPGWELIRSSAVLFMTDEGASAAMDVWIDQYRTPVLEPLDVRGLGEEAVGLAGNPMAPAERQYLYFWRRGRLLLALRASTGAGTVSVDQVRRLADRMDARAR
jgi:hypothetical protein